MANPVPMADGVGPIWRFGLFEETVAQVLKRTLLVRFLYEERDVVVATAIRDNAYRNVLHSIEHKRFEAEVAPVEIAHNTHDAHV